MHTEIARKFCKTCDKKVKAQKNKPSLAFGMLTAGQSLLNVDKSWRCSECGSKIGWLG